MMRHELRYGPNDDTHRPEFSAEQFFAVLAKQVQAGLAAFKRRCTISFAVEKQGHYLLDTHDPQLISRRWDNKSDVGIVCNEKTLSDILQGRFDLNSPRPGHLFLWGGDAEVLRALADVLGVEGQSGHRS